MTTLALDTNLDVLDKYKDLIEASLGSNSVYARLQEVLKELYKSGDIKNTDKATIVSTVLSNLNNSLVGTAMGTALQWSREEKDLYLKKADAERQLDILDNNIILSSAQAKKAKVEAVTEQMQAMRLYGKATVDAEGNVTALSNEGKVYKEIELLTQQVAKALKELDLTDAQINKIIKDSVGTELQYRKTYGTPVLDSNNNIVDVGNDGKVDKEIAVLSKNIDKIDKDIVLTDVQTFELKQKAIHEQASTIRNYGTPVLDSTGKVVMSIADDGKASEEIAILDKQKLKLEKETSVLSKQSTKLDEEIIKEKLHYIRTYGTPEFDTNGNIVNIGTYAKVPQEIEMVKKNVLKLGEDIKVAEAQAHKVYIDDIATQVSYIKNYGKPTLDSTGKAVLSVDSTGKVTKEIALLDKKIAASEKENSLLDSKVKESQAAVHKIVADTFTNYGHYTYTFEPNGNGITSVITEANSSEGSLSYLQKQISIEQAKGYAYNAWSNAVSASATLLGTGIASGGIDFSSGAGKIALDTWSSVIGKLEGATTPNETVP